LFIPASVINIVSTTFYNCTGLTSIIVDSANTKYTSRNTNNSECNVIVDKTNFNLVLGCRNTIIPD